MPAVRVFVAQDASLIDENEANGQLGDAPELTLI